MCLITTQKKPSTAEEDIIVFKSLIKTNDKTATIPFQKYNYELGTLYKTKIKGSNAWLASDRIDADWLNTHHPDWHYGTDELICLGEGYHATLTKQRAYILLNFADSYLYQCTIPKGSKYYKDATGLIVSNQIIINQIIEKYES
jgi:hypothetical protein